MRKIVAFIVVERETQSALILTQVIPHEIGVFGQVYGFQGQTPETFSSVDSLRVTERDSDTAIAACKSNVNDLLTSFCWLAAPPDPGLEPASLASMKLMVAAAFQRSRVAI